MKIMKTNNIVINSIMNTSHAISKFFTARLSLLVILLIMAGIGQLWADSWTWTAATGDNLLFGADGTGTQEGAKHGIAVLNGKKWAFERDGLYAAKTSNSSVDYLQIGKSSNAENVVLSSRAFNGTITQIDVNCSSASGKHTCKIEVGGTEVLSATNTASWTTASTLSTGTISKQGEIVITFSKSAGAAALYIHSITVTYTSTTYNVDWYVGETKQKSETGVATGTPPVVSDNALGGDCASLKFLGWSETNIGSTPSSVPADLFQPDNLPGLTKNTTYYAVFGELDYDTDDSILIQVHKYDTWSYSGTTADKSSYRLLGNGAYISSIPFRLEGLATVVICAGTYGSTPNNGIIVKDENDVTWKTGTVATSTKTTPYKLYNGTSLSGRKSLRIGSTSGDGSANGVGFTCVRIFSYVPVYSNCKTTCTACEQLDTPENLAESNVTPTSVQLSWDAVSHASSYKVTVEGYSYEKVVNGITATSVTIDDLSGGCGADYLWSVKAIGDGGDYCDSEESETGDFTTPTLSSIALSGTYPTSFAIGDAFSHEGQVVTATYSNGATKVVTGSCGWTGYDMSSGGDQTVTVSYTECTTPRTTTYGIHVATYSDYVFSCAELTLTPHLATAGTPIFITSAAGKTVRSQDYIEITGSGLTPSTTLTFPSLPAKFEIKTATYGDLTTNGEGAIDEAAYIFYTPDEGDTSDGLDKLTGITASVGGAKPKTVNLTQDIIGRHLPANFVIAGKKDGKWYALPATMESTDHPTPAEIAVDNATNPAIAYTEASNKYGLVGPTATVSGNIKSGVGQYVKLTMHPLSDAPLFGQAPSNTGIGKSGTAIATNDLSEGYWWQLKQTNTSITNPQDAKYTIYCANNTSSLSIKDNAGNPEWGLYAYGVEELRLIPASDVEYTESAVVAWGQKKLILEVEKPALATQVRAKIGEGSWSANQLMVETRTSVKGTGTRYNYTMDFTSDGFDFSDADNEGKMLIIELLNGSGSPLKATSVIIPRIVAADRTINKTNDGTKGPWNTEVHLLPGVKLTVDASTYSPPATTTITLKELHIYPGATVDVESGTLIAPTLILRNGWDRLSAKKQYEIARLYLKPDAGSLNATNAYADWYIDYDQYYPIAVPWKVTTANMSYVNTSGLASAGVTLRKYDGERRAQTTKPEGGENTNWQQYDSWPTTLDPGHGYAMTARRPAGKAFSIVRMPLTIPSADWVTNGEQGSLGEAPDDTHKDTVKVKAWAVAGTPEYAKGWNFIANPYMSLYMGEIEYTDGTEVAYLNIPDVEFKEFDQVTAETKKLKPSSAFLIQAPKDGTIVFGTANRKLSAPSFKVEAQNEQKPVQKAFIVLSGNEAEDMMGLRIGEQYTADYEINADLEKLLSDGNTLRTYMRYGDLNMAYVAINDTLAQEWIPVNVRIPADGEYTFSLHEASKVSELEGVYLIDYQNGDKITNLIEQSYTFSSTAGTINGRFSINAKVGERQTPTGIDAINAGGDINSDKPFKFIYHDKVYIWLNGVIYDTTGKRVREINK